MNDVAKTTEPFGYLYGCPSRMGDDMKAKLPAIKGVFETQRQLWNALCAIEADNRHSYRAMIDAADEKIPAMNQSLATLRDRIDATMALPRASRDMDAVKRWQTEIKDVKAALKLKRAAIREKTKAAAEALENDRRALVKKAVADSGLWWCQSEPIIERYDVARIRAMKTDSVLRARDNLDLGVLRVRWGYGIPLHVLLADTNTLCGLRMVGARHAELRICIDSMGRQKDYVTVPVVVHRPIPPGSIVRNVSLFRRRTGDTMRWHVSVVVQQPLIEARNDKADTHIVTRASIADDEAFHSAIAHVEWLQSVLDKKANKLWQDRELWRVPEDLKVARLIQDLTYFKSVNYWHLRELAKNGIGEAQDFLTDTRRMFDEMAHLRAKAYRRRDNNYRQLAANLCKTNGRLEVEKPDLMWAERKVVERAAYGEFCKILEQAGKRHGCEVNFFRPISEEKQAAE